MSLIIYYFPVDNDGNKLQSMLRVWAISRSKLKDTQATLNN